MNEKNIELLRGRMAALGFVEGVVERLCAEVCFAPAQFDMHFVVQHPTDHFEINIHFAKGERELYDALYYTAVYRKMITVPQELAALDERMKGVDWILLHDARLGSTQRAGIVEIADKAERVVKDVLENNSAGLLLFKHWVGTGLEGLIPNISQWKALYEISQRFYFMEDQLPISADEALRFLQSRWVERRMVAERRLLVRNEKPTIGGKGSGTKGTGGKLLAKRPRSSRKGLLEN